MRAIRKHYRSTSDNMLKFVVLFALVAAVYGGVVPFESPLGATLLPKVNVAPTKVTVVKQPITVEQKEYVYRSVPVPVRAVAYTAPAVAYTAPAVAYSHPAYIF
ncbi:uncharacterized protein LOC135136932 [Zophobas morio]|uniref:uncharacterized protein LOC135136932 n=1 Tax=Zophobas morio TaxID=2755281 RepID=UPI00308290A3